MKFPRWLKKKSLRAAGFLTVVAAGGVGAEAKADSAAGIPAPVVYYVSPQGKDSNPGSPERPFATLEHARDAVRAARKALNGGAGPAMHIRLRAGDYFLSASFELTAEDSGTEERPLRIETWPGEQAAVHGSRSFPAGRFESVSDPVVLARLPAGAREQVRVLNLQREGVADWGELRQHGFGTAISPAPLECFIDGQPQHLARYPNHGILKIGHVTDPGSIPRTGDLSNRGATFEYLDRRADAWAAATECWLYGRFANGYAEDHLQVARVDPRDHTMHLAQPHIYGVLSSIYYDREKWSEQTGAGLRGFYAYNLLEELDERGEYYLDRHAGLLYIFPDEKAQRVEVSLLQAPLFSLRHVAHVVISGIEFTAARGMGIYEEATTGVLVDRCSFHNLGTVGISQGERLQATPSGAAGAIDRGDFHHNAITHCRFFDNGAGGILLGGGDRRTLTAGDNRVVDCEFFRNSRPDRDFQPAIRMTGVGQVVEHCYFHDEPGQVIAYQGNDFTISDNWFERVCQDCDDLGAIYTGRDPSARGTRIRHNFFSEVSPLTPGAKVCAIYVDDGSGGITIEENIFCHAGSPGSDGTGGAVFLHGGFDNQVSQNLFIDSPVAVGHSSWTEARWAEFLKGPLMQQRLRHDVDITSPAYLAAYPSLAGFFEATNRRLNRVERNLVFRTQLTLNGELALKRNETLPAGSTAHPGVWNPAQVREQFGEDDRVRKLCAAPFGPR